MSQCTYIADSIAKNASPEAFARVSAQQLNCHMPVHSNLIEKGWSFMCDDYATEAVIYGQKGDLVMLTSMGRTAKQKASLRILLNLQTIRPVAGASILNMGLYGP